jgi:hypothetical protein
MRLFFILFFILLSAQSHAASAQLDVQSLTSPELLLEVEPEFPRPGENVTISLNDYRGGTYGSSIVWLYDGVAVEAAENRRSVTVTAGALDTPIVVEAVLNKPAGGREVLSTTLQPTYLDIIIEAQTRVPDFYRGRALPSIGSMVNATALVNDGSMRNDLVYTWRLNRQVLEGGPIRGRNQVSFATPRGENAILSVQATELNGEVVARRSIFVPSVQPTINFHEVSSLFGVKRNPISNELILVGNTATIQAEPYHLDTRVYNNPDIAQWEINNSSTQTQGGNPYQITFQRTGLANSANLGFQVRDTTQVLQGANNSIQVRF